MPDVAEDFGPDGGVAAVPGGVLDETNAEFVGGAFEAEGEHFLGGLEERGATGWR